MTPSHQDPTICPAPLIQEPTIPLSDLAGFLEDISTLVEALEGRINALQELRCKDLEELGKLAQEVETAVGVATAEGCGKGGKCAAAVGMRKKRRGRNLGDEGYDSGRSLGKTEESSPTPPSTPEVVTPSPGEDRNSGFSTAGSKKLRDQMDRYIPYSYLVGDSPLSHRARPRQLTLPFFFF